jgi:regulator of sigma E protease
MFPDDNEEGKEDKEKLPKDSPLRFKNKKPWQKAIIISAGIIFNVLFAIFLVMFCAAYYHKLPSGNAYVYIQEIADNGSNATEQGLKVGDRILSIDGINFNSAYKFIFVVQKSKYYDGYASKEAIDANYRKLVELNGGETSASAGTLVNLPQRMPEEPLKISEDVVMGLEKYKTNEIKLSENAIKLRNEIQDKSEFTPQENVSFETMALALSDTYKPMEVTVLRDNKEIKIKDLRANKEGFLGLRLESKEIFVPTTTPKKVVKASLNYLWKNTCIMVYGLWQLVTGKIPISEMHGIVAITKIGGDIIEQNGFLDGLLLTAIISVDLAIINLLPIPALDGGHLLILLIEKIFGRKLNEEKVEKISNACFFALLALMVLIIFNDIFALVTKKF